jgi:hypothetical protein
MRCQPGTTSARPACSLPLTFGASRPKRTTSATMRRKLGLSKFLRCTKMVLRLWLAHSSLPADAHIAGAETRRVIGWSEVPLQLVQPRVCVCVSAAASARPLPCSMLPQCQHTLDTHPGPWTARRTSQTALYPRPARPGSPPGWGRSSGCTPAWFEWVVVWVSVCARSN